MVTITFDTLKFVEKLRAAGVPEAQAKVQAEVLLFALDEVMDQQLATKTDIARLEREVKTDIALVRADITRLERDLFVIKWMMGMMMGGITALILKTFFPG